ncbi:murinoglobulin-2-like, partial [Diadema antillarum]|uniref:murinoglobulin-2-like n=1 Tax=Diadema antillarum TaxID=105358 RepID=UPI003A841308
MARIFGPILVILASLLASRGTDAGTIATTESPPPESSSSSGIDFDTGYLVIVPKVFVAETTETICITLQNMTGPLEVAIRLMDNTTVLSKVPLQFMEFRMACYEMQVPAIEEESMEATLVIKMRRTLVTQEGFEVVEKRLVTISGVNTEMFIETDKPVYKPGQT